MDSSGPVPSTRTRREIWELLRSNRDFRLLFLALVVSFAGDWFLFVALAGLVFDLTGSAALVAAMFASTTVPFALFSFVGGHVADRLNRRTLMVAADLARALLAMGFFLVDSPGEVWMVFVLAGAIAALGAVFEPASSAAVPNLVDGDQLRPANILSAATWGTMLAVGSAIGGVVVAAFGREVGYATDAASFLVSAVLVLRIRRPMSLPRQPHQGRPGLITATREMFRYARSDRRVLALLSVKSGFGLAGGMVALLPVLALEVFAAGDRGTGILLAGRGAGVLIGPFLVGRFMRRDHLGPLFAAIPIAFAVWGVLYLGVAWAPVLPLAGAFVLGAHLGGGAQWTLSSFALQTIVPDHIRGRVFAFDYGLITFTVALSATVAGIAADAFDVRVVMTVMAGMGVVYAMVWALATRNVRRSLSGPEPAGTVGSPPAETEASPSPEPAG